MAQVDASIPLQVKQPADYTQNLMSAIQAGEAMQQLQGQKALREAFQGADTTTPEGQQALIRKVGSADPKSAMALQGQFQQQAKTKSEITKNEAITQKTQMENAHALTSQMDDAGSVLMYQFTDLTQNKGMAPQDAARVVSANIPVLKAHLAQQRYPDGRPMFSPEQLAQMPDQFDPQKFAQMTMSARQTKEKLEYEMNIRKEKSAEQHQRVVEGQGAQRIGIEAQNSSINAGRLAEERRYHGAEEGIQKERLGIERARVAGDPDTIERNADLIGSGKMAPPTGAALRNPVMAATMARVQEKYPNFDAKTFATQQTGEKAFTSGKLGQTVRSLNVATDHLDALDEMGKKLKNGDVQAFNRLAQNIAEQTGSPAPTNFDAAKKIVADEVVKAVVGSGGGVADREEAAKAFDKVSSPEQLQGAIATAKRLMKGQLNGLKQQYKASTGKEDFDERFLSGETKGIEKGSGTTANQGGGKAAGGDFSHLWN